MIVRRKTHWQWVFSCATAVYHTIAPTRGKIVPTEFLAGARPEMWMSDRYAAQTDHGALHQVCLAHLIRDAQYAIDAVDAVFAPLFKSFLAEVCELARQRPELTDRALRAHARNMDRRLAVLLDLKTSNTKGNHLRASINVDWRDNLAPRYFTWVA